jgi:hypothetical protein
VAGNATALMRLLGRLKYLAGRSGKAARPTGADVFQARSSPMEMVGDDVALWDVASMLWIDGKSEVADLDGSSAEGEWCPGRMSPAPPESEKSLHLAAAPTAIVKKILCEMLHGSRAKLYVYSDMPALRRLSSKLSKKVLCAPT